MTPLVLAALLAAAPAPQPATAAPEELDLAAFANGALIAQSTSDYNDRWTALWLLDEDPKTGWASGKGVKGPFEIVIALPEKSEIRALEFDAKSVEGPKQAAKDVDVLVSDTSAKTGFTQVAKLVLEKADHQRFPLEKPATGRWLKLVVRSNAGDPAYTELMNVRAFGVQLTHTPPPNVSGTYSSHKYGLFHLSQNGAQLSGCYENKHGLIQGGLESHLMRLTWTEGVKANRRGPALMVLKPDGKSFRGLWQEEGSKTWHGDWDLKKVSDEVGTCPFWNPKAASGNVITSSLAASGRARLYGINFDLGSDRLRDDSKPTLGELVSALKAEPKWKITIEGHTDSTGSARENLALSRKRADSVKAFLTAAGIAANRMTTKGLGQTKPVASNDTAAGRAQNRRVEIVRH